ncbi:ADP-ribosylglycohydrolase-domain-containing protein [Lasiosphaeria hispida]|uniref:ADP-ribosylglycohydrolase-domain-containing protein n=1 Tax=Lasiosphaeria hispida TaxID=260671 RepID=A0AAJ0MB10_9PEZI|nr:ADP-ribosylglycohydrolase-domain-containing protein [Lasiosphaeria hispida]
MSLPTALNPSATTTLLHASIQDRVIGVLVGSALGDTIGLYTEFLSAATSLSTYPSRTFTLLPTPTPMKLDLHRASKEAGHWTDDTDHALLLLLAFLHTAKSLSPNDPPFPTQAALAARLRHWVSSGLRTLDTMPLGLGRLVGTVVATTGFDAEPARVAREYWERTGRAIAPNGSLMRTHPLGLMCLWQTEEVAFQLAADMSRVTHADPRCVVACVVGTGLVRALVRGEVGDESDVDAVLSRGKGWFLRGEGGELDEEEFQKYAAAGSLEELKLDEAVAIGYVYKALGAGVVLLRMAMRRMTEAGGGWLERDRLFEELVTELIMCGGDADTNACFAGALLGAYLGYGALPAHWKHGMKHEAWFLSKAEALCQVLGLKGGQYDGHEDKDTHLDGGREPITQNEMECRWMLLQQAVGLKMKEAADEENASASKRKSGWSVSLPWKDKDKIKR